MRNYICLSKQNFKFKEYEILPLRSKDRYDIMNWRNEQIYHLRQKVFLDKESQDFYFENIVSMLFKKEFPEQILFSYLKNGKCIGYGGLVHINWGLKNAEISFIMDTRLEDFYFDFHWKIFLDLIEEVAFKELKLNKIFTYAFDFRPLLYKVLEDKQYINEGRLVNQQPYENKFIDVVIHSKINGNTYFQES